jgi:hypothetical protein
VAIGSAVALVTDDLLADGAFPVELRCYPDRHELHGEAGVEAFHEDFAWSDEPRSCDSFTLPFFVRFGDVQAEAMMASRCEDDGALTRGLLSWDFAR